MKRTLLIISVSLMALSGAASAKVALSEDATVENGLVTVAIGKMLYKSCEDITPRRIKAFAFARSLQVRAKSLGYSDGEIDAYLDSEKDKNRVKAKARTYLRSKGANLSDKSSLCAVGRKEIANQTKVGQYLRVY